MFNIRIPAAAIALACLAGCAGQVQLTSPNTSPIDAAIGRANAAAVTAVPKLATIEKKISAGLVNACGWEPTASTLGRLAATISGNALASSLASAIAGLTKATCAAVTASASNGMGLLDRAPVPTYRGVPLIGRFVR